MSDSKFKIGDLVRGEDDWCISIGILISIPSPYNPLYIIDVLSTERKSIVQINTQGKVFRPNQITLIELPYSKMLQKHGHKKSWNTVLPKPSLEPKVGSFVKILPHNFTAENGFCTPMWHSLASNSYGEIISITPSHHQPFRILGVNQNGDEWDQWLAKSQFKVLI